MLKIYVYEKCDTCRKALTYLKANGVDFESIPIVEQPPTTSELRTASRQLGDFRKLFNTSGLSYRALNLGARIKTMSEAEAFGLLEDDGKLIKRPFVIGPGVAMVGFKPDEWKKAGVG
jgi:arsenate reductase